jgi:hypothetical protein
VSTTPRGFARLYDVGAPRPGDPVEPTPTNLGGTFATAPAAIALTPNRLDVFGLGTDYNVCHKTGTVGTGTGDQWQADWDDLGGNFSCTPVVVSAQANSIDLFGLGADLTMLRRSYDGNKWSAAWDLLGDAFISPPVALPAPSGTFDIFARGLDFLIYHANWKPGTTAQWSKLGGGLRGEPKSASAPPPWACTTLLSSLQPLMTVRFGTPCSMETTGSPGHRSALWKAVSLLLVSQS